MRLKVTRRGERTCCQSAFMAVVTRLDLSDLMLASRLRGSLHPHRAVPGDPHDTQLASECRRVPPNSLSEEQDAEESPLPNGH